MMRYLQLTLILMLFTLFQSSLGAQVERKAKISTDFGDMIIKLYNDTPLHRDNFINNVESGTYNDVLFHRVMPFFMMQGGDPSSKNAAPDQPLGRDNCPQIKAEIIPGRFHKKGALAAARIPDVGNPERLSSGCQFFIVQGYKHTDAQLASSGKVLTEIQNAWYKVRGGMPFLDNDYSVFGEVVEGLEVIDLICGIKTHKGGNIKDRPVEDVKMTITMIN